LNYLDRFSKKYSNMKFDENMFGRSRDVPLDGRIDRYDEATT